MSIHAGPANHGETVPLKVQNKSVAHAPVTMVNGMTLLISHVAHVRLIALSEKIQDIVIVAQMAIS